MPQINNAAVAHPQKRGIEQADLCVEVSVVLPISRLALHEENSHIPVVIARCPSLFHITTTNHSKVNYFGTRRVCESLLPLLRPGGRVINVSSSVGQIAVTEAPGCPLAVSTPGCGLSADLKRSLLSATLTIEDLDDIMRAYLAVVHAHFRPTVATNTNTKADANTNTNTNTQSNVSPTHHPYASWPEYGYAMSKIAVTQLTRLLAKQHPRRRLNDAATVGILSECLACFKSGNHPCSNM